MSKPASRTLQRAIALTLVASVATTLGGCGRLLLPSPVPGRYATSTANWDGYVILGKRLSDTSVQGWQLAAYYAIDSSPDEVDCFGWVLGDHVADPRSGDLCFLLSGGSGRGPGDKDMPPRVVISFAPTLRLAHADAPNDWYSLRSTDLDAFFTPPDPGVRARIFAIQKDDSGRVVALMDLDTAPKPER